MGLFGDSESKEIKNEEVKKMGEPIIATGGSSTEFESVPEGTHQAVCIGVHDLGKQESLFGVKHQIVISWEVAVKRTEGDKKGTNFTISKFYTLSLDQRANLRKDIESWRGKSLTEEEVKAGLDVSVLKGQGCLLSVVQEKKTNKTVSKINGVIALPTGTPIIPITVPEANEVPEWIKDRQAKQV